MKKLSLALALCVLEAAALAIQVNPQTRAAGGSAGTVTVNAGEPGQIIIKRIERTGPGEKVPWLGVSTEEVSEAMAAQLKLKSGEGLLITHVAEDSPAAKAGLKKHDVLVSIDDQLLLVPEQLRKLIRSRKEGSEISITCLRDGERVNTRATLGLTEAPAAGPLGSIDLDADRWIAELRDTPAFRDGMRSWQRFSRELREGNTNIHAEVRRSIDAAREAVHEALRNASNNPSIRALRDMARSGAVVGDQSTVTVRSQSNTSQSLVKTDPSGTYIITANPEKHLTARDKTGKLAFEGPIETPEQQAKVPKEVWEQVRPMLDQLKKAPEGSQGKIEEEIETEIRSGSTS